MLTYDDCEKIYNEHIAAEELCAIWGGDAGVAGYVEAWNRRVSDD